MSKFVISVLVLLVGCIFQRVANSILVWYKDEIASKTVTTLDEEFIPLIRRTAIVLIWIMVFLIILPIFGVNISALITALGISSLAIALAAQDTIANIIAGFLIMIDRPFRVGDKIKLPSGEVVEVLNIGIRRSTFSGEDKAIIIVPNLDLSKSKIVNYSYGREELRGIKEKRIGKHETDS